MSEIIDGIREYAVFRMHCAKCGLPLRVTYDPDKGRNTKSSNDGITVAAKVDFGLSVWPCRNCYDKVKRPLELIKEAMESIK